MDKKEISNPNVDDDVQASNVANSFIATLDRIDRKVIGFMSSYAILIIRLSLGIVFVWFGLLKVMGVSPVFDLASHIVYWLPSELFVPLLGIWEMAIGVGLLLGKALRVILSLPVSSTCRHIPSTHNPAGGCVPRGKSSVPNHRRRVCDKESSSDRCRAGGRRNGQIHIQRAASGIE